MDTPEGTVVPNLEGVNARADTAKFLFWLYPSRNGTGKREAELRIEKEGKLVGVKRLETPSEGAQAVRVISSLELDGFELGAYEIEVVARQGREIVAVRSQLLVTQ